ncbi:MAG: hypothetical protein BWK80_32210 [Desulfobacteraceae bacterium IS3]|nr:MAG: hypothetical protein BWK80_32210 [Desulfobacteraceae bacterium IS3]
MTSFEKLSNLFLYHTIFKNTRKHKKRNEKKGAKLFFICLLCKSFANIGVSKIKRGFPSLNEFYNKKNCEKSLTI